MLQLEDLLEVRSTEFWRGEPTSPGCVFDPYMYGRSVDCAQPAIVLSCLSKRVRRNAKNIIQHHDFQIDPRGIGIDYYSSSPGSFAGTSSAWDSCVASSAPSEKDQRIDTNPLGLELPYLELCGETIHVGSATCTMGGLIAIDGTLYYQTVAHVFEKEGLEPQKTSQPCPNPVIYGAGAERLGVLHRKRYKPNQRAKDMDWAICIPDRILGDMPLNRSICAKKYPTKIVQDILGGAEVLVQSRFGVEKGILLGDCSLVALPGTEKFQRMWAVKLERDVAPGDCGSWVLDAAGESLYGHIVAGKPGTGLAYLILARVVFEDIRVQCEANQVTLPTEQGICAYRETASRDNVKSGTRTSSSSSCLCPEYLPDLRQGQRVKDTQKSKPPSSLQRGAMGDRRDDASVPLWIILILATVSYVLTSLYAWHPELLSRNLLFGRTPAKARQVLSVLSSITGYLLFVSIWQSFDLARALLIARASRLLHHKTFQRGALVRFPRNSRWHHTLQRRLYDALLVICSVIIPILGIVIMRDVETTLIFYPKTATPVFRGSSATAFDASLAPLLQPITDVIFSTRFKDFLSDPDLVIDVSTDADRKTCSHVHKNNTKINCQSKYFLPGSIEQFAPQLLVDEYFQGVLATQPILAKNHHGYYLEFEDSDSIAFNHQTDCVRHGYALGAYQLCLKDISSHQITAFLTHCPKSLAANLSCLNNVPWPLDDGWGTTLSTYIRPADVAYNALNGTILSHSFPNTTLTPGNINAKQLLQVFDVLVNTSNINATYESILAPLGFASNQPIIPLVIWQYFQSLKQLSKIDRNANRRAVIGLQSLLAIPIYHCQAKDFSEFRRLLSTLADGHTLDLALAADVLNSLPVVKLDTDIYPALMRFTVRIGGASLLAYVVLTGCTLFMCIVTNGIASFAKARKRFKNTMSFPLLTSLYDLETNNFGRVSSQKARDHGTQSSSGFVESKWKATTVPQASD
ncbi:hypothetical protein BKA65DRAFT_558385 [Rhexocercosporidium sp. MPI-PUGE-AT-0058]|nr:hypothetical protein BKA65DRAFT_558385 [Rhexocercosporidium sp. MPI-PUGE-AT-0058]